MASGSCMTTQWQVCPRKTIVEVRAIEKHVHEKEEEEVEEEEDRKAGKPWTAGAAASKIPMQLTPI